MIINQHQRLKYRLDFHTGNTFNLTQVAAVSLVYFKIDIPRLRQLAQVYILQPDFNNISAHKVFTILTSHSKEPLYTFILCFNLRMTCVGRNM
jgi:hypothetical protein